MSDQEPGDNSTQVAAIEQEVREGLQRHSGSLANFRAKFPSMSYRELDKGHMDEPHRKFFKSHEDFSERYLTQTPREFFKAVDESFGEDLPQVVATCKEYLRLFFSKPQNREDIISKGSALMRIENEIDEMLIPGYIKLRLQGYSRKDLIT